MPVSNVREVFDRHLKKKLAQSSDTLSRIDAVYKFVIEGPEGGVWVVDLKTPGGTIREGDGPADCCLTLGAADFLALLNGEIKPAEALLSGRLKVEGDPTVAFKLQALFT